MKRYKRITINIFTIVIVILAMIWFRLPIAGTIILVMVWTSYKYRRQRAKLWVRVKNSVPFAGSLLSGLVFITLGIGAGITTYRFGIELISVPSASMEASIHSGKYILVNKLKPGPRRFASRPDKYFRMAGTSELKRGDIVLFNFPEGDTILENRPDESYYFLKRHFNAFDRLRKIRQWGRLIPLKVEDRPRFVKRLAGLPGDTLQVKEGDIFINGEKAGTSHTIIKKFRWDHTREAFAGVIGTLNILDQYTTENQIEVEMTTGNYLGLDPKVKVHLKPALLEKNVPDRHIFPFNTSTSWNTDHLGPVYIPRAGDTLRLTPGNLQLYKRAISVYEGNSLEIRKDSIYINGKASFTYCFKLNYYWAMGDNRPHSFDSRFWGFLPENHIIGSIPSFLVNKK